MDRQAPPIPSHSAVTSTQSSSYPSRWSPQNLRTGATCLSKPSIHVQEQVTFLLTPARVPTAALELTTTSTGATLTYSLDPIRLEMQIVARLGRGVSGMTLADNHLLGPLTSAANLTRGRSYPRNAQAAKIFVLKGGQC